jgi:hypothetical protein
MPSSKIILVALLSTVGASAFQVLPTNMQRSKVVMHAETAFHFVEEVVQDTPTFEETMFSLAEAPDDTAKLGDSADMSQQSHHTDHPLDAYL